MPVRRVGRNPSTAQTAYAPLPEPEVRSEYERKRAIYRDLKARSTRGGEWVPPDAAGGSSEAPALRKPRWDYSGRTHDPVAFPPQDFRLRRVVHEHPNARNFNIITGGEPAGPGLLRDTAKRTTGDKIDRALAAKLPPHFNIVSLQ